MPWKRMCRIKGLLVISLGVLCFLDSAITYYLLKTFPLDFREANPATIFLIKCFGLERSLLIISPVAYVASLSLLYFFWNISCKKNYFLVIAIISVGFCLVFLLRLAAVSWNFYEFYRTFA